MAQFTNQAQLSYNSSVINSNVVIGEIVQSVSATKKSLTDSYTADEDITYVISIINSGDDSISGVTITDNLGKVTLDDGTEVYPLTYIKNSLKVYINGVLQTGPITVVEGPPLSISGITIPADSDVIILYEVNTNNYTPLDTNSEISNEAIITADNVSPITVSNTIEVQTGPKLTVTKNISPVPVVENGTVTYTFIIENYGNTPARLEDNVILDDIFNPILDNISVTFNGNLWAENVNYQYDNTTGGFSTIPGEITVDKATFVKNRTGEWTVLPSSSKLVITGRLK